MEVALGGLLFEVWQLALVDAMRGGDDAACGRLPEHLRQPDHGNRPRADHVGQHLARPDRRQLIDIADNQKGGAVRQRFQKRVHERHIHHGGFVDHKEVGIERIVLILEEAAPFGIGFEKTVNGLRFKARGFGHALGGAPRRRAKQHGDRPSLSGF